MEEVLRREFKRAWRRPHEVPSRGVKYHSERAREKPSKSREDTFRVAITEGRDVCA